MAEIVRTYTDDNGHTINVYKSGAEYNTDRKRLIKPSESGKITVANTSERKRQRQAKTAALLRQAIVTETVDKLDVPGNIRAPAAVAAAGGILWREIVLDRDQYARDRLAAWEKIGQRAEILTDNDVQEQTAQAPQMVMAVTELVRAIRDAITPDNVIDNNSYNNHEEDDDT